MILQDLTRKIDFGKWFALPNIKDRSFKLSGFSDYGTYIKIEKLYQTPWVQKLKKLAIWATVTGGVVGTGLLGAYTGFEVYKGTVTSGVLSPRQVRNEKYQDPTIIVDQNGNIIGNPPDYWATDDFEKLSDNIKFPVQWIEDRGFFTRANVAVSPKRMFIALGKNILAGKITSGASTITQQFAGFYYSDTVDRSKVSGFDGIKRKIDEIIIADYIAENFADEDEETRKIIFEEYVSKVPVGPAKMGLRNAVDFYFPGRSIIAGASNEISLAQGLMIAGLIQSPSRNYPGTEALLARARRALSAMQQSDDPRFRLTAEEVEKVDKELLAIHAYFQENPVRFPRVTSGKYNTLPSSFYRLMQNDIKSLRDRGLLEADGNYAIITSWDQEIHEALNKLREEILDKNKKNQIYADSEIDDTCFIVTEGANIIAIAGLSCLDPLQAASNIKIIGYAEIFERYPNARINQGVFAHSLKTPFYSNITHFLGNGSLFKANEALGRGLMKFGLSEDQVRYASAQGSDYDQWRNELYPLGFTGISAITSIESVHTLFNNGNRIPLSTISKIVSLDGCDPMDVIGSGCEVLFDSNSLVGTPVYQRAAPRMQQFLKSTVSVPRATANKLSLGKNLITGKEWKTIIVVSGKTGTNAASIRVNGHTIEVNVLTRFTGSFVDSRTGKRYYIGHINKGSNIGNSIKTAVPITSQAVTEIDKVLESRQE